MSLTKSPGDIIYSSDWNTLLGMVGGSSGSPECSASYIVYVDGGTYYAKNGHTSAVTSNTNLATLINGLIVTLPTSGGAFLFKAGVYTLTASIEINRDYVSLQGEAWSFPDTAYAETVTGSGIVKFMGNVDFIKIGISGARKSCISISNIYFLGDTSTSGKHGIIDGDAADCDQTQIFRCSFFHLQTGIQLGNSANNKISDAPHVYHCAIHNCGDGIEISESNYAKINDCEISDNDGWGIKQTYDLENMGNRVKNCNMIRDYSGAIYVDGDNYDAPATWFMIEGCTMRLSGNGYGVHFLDMNSGSITGCYMESNLKHGIYLQTSDGIVINGNTIVNNGFAEGDTYSGIHVDVGVGNVITGNRLGGNDKYDVSFTANANYNLVHGNTFYGSDATAEISDAGTGNQSHQNILDDGALVD